LKLSQPEQQEAGGLAGGQLRGRPGGSGSAGRLSQQIKALEHDLGVRLFDRDRRSVALTPAGAALLPPTRALLEGADDLQRRAAQISGFEPVRLGYVEWLPPDLTARTSAVAQLRTDVWASWNLYAGQLARTPAPA
jgi:hypothetical protein